ncbi:MAG: PAS domain S-box protein [bacterium]|nr:PAS domain S-box protein [bacterium]
MKSKCSERDIKNLLEALPDGVLVVDVAGNIANANKQIETLFGYKRQELLTMAFDELLSASSKTNPQWLHGERFSQAKLPTKSLIEDYIGTRKDGSKFSASITTSGVETKNGWMSLAVVRDITNRKHLDEKMSRFATAVIDSDDAITIHDTDGRITAWNRGGERMYGYSEEEALQMSIWLLAPPDRVEEQKEFIYRLVAGETISTYETQRITKDGRILDVWLSVTKMVDETGKIIAIATTERDVTKRKKMEREIQDTKEYLQTVLDSSPLPVIAHDAQGNITRWNLAAETLFGWLESEVIGKPPPIIPTDQFPTFVENITRIASGEKIVYHDVPMLCKSGDLIPCDISIGPFGRSRTETTGFVAIISDVRERKQADKDRLHYESELRQAHKMEAVGRLAGGVAHDFNNMLSVIISYTELIMSMMKSDNPMYSYLHEIRKAGLSSAELTKQLLAFSRKQTTTPKVIKLDEVVAGVKKMLSRLVREEIRLKVISIGELWQIQIDPTQIEQVLTNLIVNSKDAISGNGTITIEMANTAFDETVKRRELSAAPGDYVMLAVSDTGCGMDAKTLENVFDPFFTTKEEGKGTGLGLSTVFGIVKQNEGVIHVYSEPSIGTTFKIYFPRFIGEVGDQSKKEEKIVLTGTETILIVEDELAVLNVVRVIVEEHGYKTLTADNPVEALLLVQEYNHPIDLMLTDVVMPTMNGKELKTQVEVFRPGIKTLFMSGYTSNIIADRGLIDESINFIHKPFSRLTLLQKMREVLDSSFSKSGNNSI